MPSCFQLVPKGADKADVLQDVDSAIWCHFHGSEPENNISWYKNWYNDIGLLMACGKSYDDLREIFRDQPNNLMIVEWLEQRYDIRCWREH